jgi:hypothetical protein
MRTHIAKAPDAATFDRAYPGAVGLMRRMRAELAAAIGECPAAGDLVLLASELAANAVVHSRSGWPGGQFTVRTYLYPGDYAWVEVEDQGGAWASRPSDDRPHGLDIVAAIAGVDNWGIDGGPHGRVVWFRLDWAERS